VGGTIDSPHSMEHHKNTGSNAQTASKLAMKLGITNCGQLKA